MSAPAALNVRLRAELEALAEPGYRDFQSRLIPGLPPGRLLGVRLPALRKIARRLAKGDWQTYLAGALDDSFEETLLQGMVIGYLDVPFAALSPLIERFLPKIDNWSVCDSFCAGLKAARRYPEEMWTYLAVCRTSGRTYTVRFGVVMLLHFVQPERLDAALAALSAVRHEDYYVKMAVAWVLSMYFAAFPAQTLCFLQETPPEDEIYRRTLQKILESKQVCAADRRIVRALRDQAWQGGGARLC